jgi:hypothetical protein
VEVDGGEAGTIKAGGQLSISVAAGSHAVCIHIPLSFESATLTVSVAQESEQYLKVSRDLDGIVINPALSMPLFTLNLKVARGDPCPRCHTDEPKRISTRCAGRHALASRLARSPQVYSCP